MPSRRQHTKTRHGCLTCKRRKVRCGQERPVCENCIRLKRTCNYPDLLISEDYDQPRAQAPNMLMGYGEPLEALSTISIESAQDLELLHHYTMHTSRDMTDNPVQEALWRENIPRYAFSYRFLLHGILSAAALHRCQNCFPGKRTLYTDLARKHHGQALAQYIPLLGSVDQYNCHALFAFSMFVCTLSYGLLQISNNEDMTAVAVIEGVVGTFDLLRGVVVIAERARDWLRAGDLSPMMGLESMDPMSPTVQSRFDSEEALFLLQHDLTGSQAPPVYGAAPAGLSQDKCITSFTFAIQTLVRLRSASELDSMQKLRSVMAWPVFVDDAFIKLLKVWDPVALVILSHYAAALNQLDDTWFVRGLGSRLNKALMTIVEVQWWPYLNTFS